MLEPRRRAFAVRVAEGEQRAPVFEIRPQVVYISLLDSSTLEIRVEESWKDFDGKNPSSDWQLRQGDSFQLLSHSK